MTVGLQDSNSLKVSDSLPGSRQIGGCGDPNSITINVPSQKEIAKNKEFFSSVLRKLRDGKQKDVFSNPGNTSPPEEEEQIMSYEEIAIYVDTKARYTGCNTNRIFQVKSSLRSDEGQVKVR